MNQPGGKRPPVHLIWLLALPAAVAIWSGWVGLGSMAGFGVVHPLPGIWDDFRINTAITLPVGMEAYAAFGIAIWLWPSRIPQRARDFARTSGLIALVLGALGQIAYHLMSAAGYTKAPWPIVMLVSCVPVAVLGMGAALRHLLMEDETDQAAQPRTDWTATRPQAQPDRTVPVVDYPTVTPQLDSPQPSPYAPLARPVPPAFAAPSAPPDGRLSLRDLVNAADQTGPPAAVPNAPEPERAEPEPAPTPVRPPTVSAAQPKRTEATAVRNKADIQAARKVADRLARSGQPLTRDRLVAGLRTDGYTCSNSLASQLLVDLRSAKPDRPRLHVAGGA